MAIWHDALLLIVRSAISAILAIYRSAQGRLSPSKNRTSLNQYQLSVSTFIAGSCERLAIAERMLIPYCPERWPLVAFWQAASGVQDLGRGQSTTAAFNGIVRQLRLSGAWGRQRPD